MAACSAVSNSIFPQIDSLQEEALALVRALPAEGKFSTPDELKGVGSTTKKLYQQVLDMQGAILGNCVFSLGHKAHLDIRIKGIENGLALVDRISRVVDYMGRFMRLPVGDIFPVPIPIRTQVLATYLIEGHAIAKSPFIQEGKKEPVKGVYLIKYGDAEDVAKEPHIKDDPSSMLEEQAMHLRAMKVHSATVVPLAWISAEYLTTPRFAMNFHGAITSIGISLISSLPAMQDLIESMAHILLELEERKLVHGDIKPENLAWNGSGVRIFDFGRTRFLGEGGLYGTSGFTPPECYLRRYVASSQQDVWSIGAVLMNLITGTWDQWNIYPKIEDKIKKGEISQHMEYQYFGAELTKVSQAQVDELVDMHVETPQLRDLLKRMLSMDPTKRITAAEILAHPYLSI